jgi:hypothetical protein
MTTRKFYAQQQKRLVYQSFEIHHPAVGFIRYVGGAYFPKTLTIKSGDKIVFQPIQMKVGLPSMGEFNTLSMKIEIGRVGTEVKKNLTMINDYNLANPNTETTPFIYRQFTDGFETARFSMWVKDILIDGQNVAISASDDNPSAISVAELATVERFPGLEVLS